jgi:DNA-binding XRE family transcriptional regulator
MRMKRSKQARLERAGWRVGDAQEFLKLTDVESALIDMRVALAQALKGRRKTRRISQAALAARVGSSQSRVAKMEAGDPSVSIDLLLRSLVMAGTSRAEIGRAISATQPAKSTTRRKTA